VPLLRLAPTSLEERLRRLVEVALRRPLTERILARDGDREAAPETPSPESRVARAFQGLRTIIEGSALHVGARRMIEELEALWGRPAGDDATISLPLVPPTEAALDEIEHWLQLAPDDRSATAWRRQIGQARGLDWPRVEALLVEALERHLTAPDERSIALGALQALLHAHALLEVSILARIYGAWYALLRDLRRPFIALDAGKTHHTLLTRWKDLPKTGEFRAPMRDGRAEIIAPDARGKMGLRLDVHEIPLQLIEAIRKWRSWHGLRHWAALQRLFTTAGRTGRIRWNLNGHLDALGLSERSRREPRIRQKIAHEVEALTRLEIAVYNTDGSLRLRGPILAVTQRGEALRGSEWALEGMELVIHPVLYEGVRKSTGEIGTLWTPAPVELAHIDERTHPHALALGLLLPIRWRWDHSTGQDHLVLSGKKLLETAGIPRSANHPGRAWQTLDRNLQALQALGGLGRVEWDVGEQHTLEGRCHLHPPTWVRDRLVHGLFPEEAGRDAEVLTGSDLAEWRRSLRLSQEALAGQLDLCERTIRRAETSPDHPLTPVLRKALARFQRSDLVPSNP
jgi:hypothetical protein